jgi:fucose permease
MLTGCIALVIAIAFLFTSLPDIKEYSQEDMEENPYLRMLPKHSFFILAVVIQFLYVAGQIGVNFFFIN